MIDDFIDWVFLNWKHLSKSDSTFISQWTSSVRQIPTKKLQLTCKIEGCRFPLLRVSAMFSSHDLASVSLCSIWSRSSIPIGICKPLLTRVSISSRWGRWVPFYNQHNLRLTTFWNRLQVLYHNTSKIFQGKDKLQRQDTKTTWYIERGIKF